MPTVRARPLRTRDRWERELAPFVTNAIAPRWELLTEVATGGAAAPFTRAAGAAEPAAPAAPATREATPSLLVLPSADEVEALIAKELKESAAAFPGRKRSSVSGALAQARPPPPPRTSPRSRMLISTPATRRVN
jgi:hypothetical protein